MYVGTRAKFIQYIKELGVASSLTYRGIVTFFSRFYPPISIGGRGGAAYSCSKPSKQGLWGDQQSKSSSVCYSSHRWKRPLLYATRSRCPCAPGRWTSKRLHNYTYMKNCAEYHTNVCICVCPYWIWVALVTPLFEATDRPGVPVLCSSSYDGGVRIDNDKVNRMEIGQRYIQKTWNIEVYHICRITRSNKLVVKPEQFAFPMILLNLLSSPYKHVGK